MYGSTKISRCWTDSIQLTENTLSSLRHDDSTTVSRESRVATQSFRFLATNNDQRHLKRREGTVVTSLASEKMGDHSAETLICPYADEALACNRLFGGQDLYVDENSIPLISKHIDCFVSQSRGNESISTLVLYPHASFNGHDDDLWEKVGQAVCSLQALKRLRINPSTPNSDDRVGTPILDWEILASILKYMRRRIIVEFDDGILGDAEESRLFARVIHRHPSICSFEGGGRLSYESMDILYSALATLPALKSIQLYNPRAEDISTLANSESLTELLRVPTLRYVNFYGFSFTPALFQATANALMEGTAITNLEFTACSFAAEISAAMMTKGLSRNTSVTCIAIMSPRDGILCNALAAALPSNSTLTRLSLGLGWRINDSHISLSRFLSALGQNTGLKTLIVQGSCSMDESLCTAMRNGLGMNATLERLELEHVPLCDDNAVLWCRAFSFLRTNKALKYFVINVRHAVTGSCVSAFLIDIAAMLQENTSLESISTLLGRHKIEAEEYIAIVAAIQLNTTLKTLSINQDGSLRLTVDEGKQMAALLKKNFAMESLPDIDLESQAGDVGAILRLNAAGRRYLIEDGSSISKGVEVLSRVNNDINCVFLHLLENPRLCDRSAVEKVSAGESNSSLINSTAGSGDGKRERVSVHEGKASHRRLASFDSTGPK
jgi:hypothetical protein